MKRTLLAAWLVVLVLHPVLAGELDATKLAAIRPRMQQFVDQQDVSGVVTLVGRHDRVVSLEAIGCQDLEARKPMRPDSIFRIASMTKPITAIGIMLLVDEGKLAIDDPVEKYLPAFRGQQLAVKGQDGVTLRSPSRPITLCDLLTHTSGMPGGLPRRPDSLYAKRDLTLAEAVPIFAKEPLAFEPGTKWAYCNIGIDTLGRIIEVASGQPYETFLKTRIFDPLGMVDTSFYPSPAQAERIAVTYRKENGKLVPSKADILGPPAGAKYPIPAGGLYSTAGDLVKVYQMMLNHGELGGKRILSPASVETMTRVHTGELTAGFTSGVGYGLGWGIVRTPTGVTAMLSPGTFGHGGAFGTQGWIDPQKDLIVILLIQRVGLPNGDASELRHALQEVAVSALGR